MCVCTADSMDSNAKQLVNDDESHVVNGDGPSAGQFLMFNGRVSQFVMFNGCVIVTNSVQYMVN